MNCSHIVTFLKNWTLPVAMSLGTLAYLLFAFTPALDEAAAIFDVVFDAIFPLFMFLILFVTFCKVDFRRMRLVRWHLNVSIVQLVLSVAMVAAVASSDLAGAELVLAQAVLVCIVAPTATAAAVVTSKLGGDLEAMTSYTFCSNLLSAIYVPLFFPLVGGGDADFLANAAGMLWRVSLVLVLPMAGAWTLGRVMPRLHRRIAGCRDLSFYLWGCSLAIVTGTTVKHIVHADVSFSFLLLLATAALLVCLVQFGAGRLAGRSTGCPADAGQALGQKNTAFAIWIAYTYLTPLCSVGPGCYILWQNIINSYELWDHRQTA